MQVQKLAQLALRNVQAASMLPNAQLARVHWTFSSTASALRRFALRVPIYQLLATVSPVALTAALATKATLNARHAKKAMCSPQTKLVLGVALESIQRILINACVQLVAIMTQLSKAVVSAKVRAV